MHRENKIKSTVNDLDTPHVGLMYYSWSFRVGYIVASTDHG